MAFNIRIIVLSCIALVLSSETWADSMLQFFKKETVHQCPEVRGTLTLDGKPLAGIKVYRRLTTYDKPKDDSTTTDNNGTFHFPLVEMKKRNANPWGMTQTHQDIWVEHDGKRRKLWEGSSPNIFPHKGITKKLAQLNCDLNEEERWIGFPNEESEGNGRHAALTVCRWDMPGDYFLKQGGN